MTNPGTHRWRPGALTWRVAAVLALVPITGIVEPLRVPVLLIGVWAAVAAAAAGLVRHRPPASSSWWYVSFTLALLAAAQTTFVVEGRLGLAPRVMFLVTQVICLAALFATLRRRWGSHRSAVLTPFPWVDGVVVTAGCGLAMTDAALHVLDGGGSWVVLGAVSVVLCLGALGLAVWLFATRSPFPPTSALVMIGLSLTALQEALLSAAPAASSAFLHPASALGAAASGMFILATADPGMRSLGATPERGGGGRLSTRLIALLAFAVVPWVTIAFDTFASRPVLPSLVAPTVDALITVLALVRSLALLRASEGLAEVDTLTGLLNRRGLMREFDAGRHLDQPMWLALVDTDAFKGINDRYGHDAGDLVLQSIAARLVRASAGRGTACRTGGDEFVVLWRGDDPDDLIAALEEHSGDAVVVSGVRLAVGCSIGLAPVAGRPITEALAEADAAMYAAKARGGSRVLRYEPSLRSQALGRAELVRDLHALIAAPGDEAGRLVVLYQPVVAAATGEPLAVEALVRWVHPDRGTVPPDEFLPLVEELGLGAELDRQVLDQAVHQIAAWDAAGLHRVHRVGVNLGAGSLRSPTLVADVDAACARAGIGHDRLCLEVTEHEAAPTDATTVAGLQALADAGVVFALDDFGSGYAGVGYLLRFPISIVKLDRSLLPDDRAARAVSAVPAPVLIAGVMEMARASGLEVTAEGVETPQQLDLLRSLGVHHVQGWLFARAMEPAAVAEFWRSGATSSPASLNPAAAAPMAEA